MIANKKKNLNPLVSVGFPVRNGEQTLKKALNSILKQTETNLKFGIFSLTLQYFRAMTLVRRQYETWSGRKAAMALEGKVPPREVTEEREKMENNIHSVDE